MKSVSNVAIGILSVLIWLQSFICLTAHGQTEDLAHVFNALSPQHGKLSGYKITALETNITFNQNSFTLEILQSSAKTNLTKSQIATLEEFSRNNAGNVTNICSYVYKFENDVIYISCEQFDTSGKLTQKDTTLVTSNEIREYHNPVDVVGASGERRSGMVEIRNRETGGLFGLPIYLSKSTLRDWMEDSSVKSYGAGKSSAGQDCYIITLSGTPESPIKTNVLYLRLDTFSPVEYDGYMANGTLFAKIVLEFEEPGIPPFVCIKADSQSFESGKLSRQFVWAVQNIEADKAPLSENVETFIPPKTQVLDQRFSKPLNYHMGAHPPTPAQINLMLTDRYGAASYESGLFIKAGTKKISDERRNWIRGIFIAFIISPLLIFVPRMLKKN